MEACLLDTCLTNDMLTNKLYKSCLALRELLYYKEWDDVTPHDVKALDEEQIGLGCTL